MVDGEPVAPAATAALLFLSLDSAGAVCITNASPSPGRLDEVHGLSQPSRHKQPTHAPQNAVGSLRRLPYGKARSVHLRARSGESRRLRRLSLTARNRESAAFAQTGRAIPLPAMSRRSACAQCSAWPP